MPDPIPSFEDFKAQQSQAPASGSVPSFEDFKKQQQSPPSGNSMPESQPSGFLASVGHQLSALNPFPAIKQKGAEMSRAVAAHDIPGIIKGSADLAFPGVSDAISEVGKAGQALVDPAGGSLPMRAMTSLGHGMAAITPGGPQAVNAGETAGTQAASGDLPGVAGTVAGAALPMVAGEGIGRGMKAIAPPLAESAMRIQRGDRGFSRTPGQAIIDDTHGAYPDTVAASAGNKINELTPELESHVRAAQGPASLKPARGVVGAAMDKAVRQNADATYSQLQPMNAHLTTEFGTGKAIPEDVTPERLLDLKRGFSEKTKWNPEMHTSVNDTGRATYRALDDELDRTVPEAADLNQRISSLIPVKNRASSLSRAPSVAQNILHRVIPHTGALVGTMEGYRLGGVPGAIMGAAIPEIIGSPAMQMSAARGLNLGGKMLISPAKMALLTGKRQEE